MRVSLQLNPDLKPATSEEIKAIRDLLELSPVNSGGLVFDANEKAIMRMERALANFVSLPTLLADGRLYWKMADNSITAITKAQLEDALRDIAIRAAKLHVHAAQLQLQANTTGLAKGQIKPETWPV